MSTAGKDIVQGLENAVAHARGDAAKGRQHVFRVPDEIDVKAIRNKLTLTQAAFADRYGFALGAVRDWEQGRRRPEPSARILLKVIDREPRAVERALA